MKRRPPHCVLRAALMILALGVSGCIGVHYSSSDGWQFQESAPFRDDDSWRDSSNPDDDDDCWSDSSNPDDEDDGPTRAPGRRDRDRRVPAQRRGAP